MSPQRILLLNKVLNHEESLASLQKQLGIFPWDYEGEPVVLSKATLANTLSQYIDGTLQTSDVNDWANFLELRDDINYAQDDESLLSDIMHELANPDTEGKLTPERVTILLKRLHS